jgi:prevent-host-death family protein
MKDIGIRELKAHASELIRRVTEEHATYTITRRGRAVGVLAPPDFLAPDERHEGRQAWKRLLALADRMSKQKSGRRSAVKELAAMRR